MMALGTAQRRLQLALIISPVRGRRPLKVMGTADAQGRSKRSMACRWTWGSVLVPELPLRKRLTHRNALPDLHLDAGALQVAHGDHRGRQAFRSRRGYQPAPPNPLLPGGAG
jgi:hypothetical protein